MKRLAIPAIGAALTFVLACSGSEVVPKQEATYPASVVVPKEEATYPASVVQDYMTVCTRKGTPEYCSCVLEEIRKRFSLEEYRNLVPRIRASGGLLPDDLAFAVPPCYHLRSTPGITAPTATPRPASERVELATNVSTEYYTVQGATTDEIFASMEANGLLNDKGERAQGLTEMEWTYVWNNSYFVSCGDGSITITMGIIVRLPRLDDPSRLSGSLLPKWEKFSADLAGHEQGHVDIYLDGANSLERTMEAILSRRASCSSLDTEIRSAWEAQGRLTDDQQEGFHEAEDFQLAALRAPLEAKIEASEARLAELGAQIDALETELGSLENRAGVLESELNSLEVEIASIEARYPGWILPGPVYDHYENLVDQYNNLVPRYNSLLGEHDSLFARYSPLVDEHNALAAATGQLIDEFNWLQ